MIFVTSYILEDFRIGSWCFYMCDVCFFKISPAESFRDFFQQQHVKQYNGLFFEKNLKGIFIVAEICCMPFQVCKQCRDISQIVSKSKTFSKKLPLDSLTSWVLLQLSAIYGHLYKTLCMTRQGSFVSLC